MTEKRKRTYITETDPRGWFDRSDGSCLVGDLAQMLTKSGHAVSQNKLFSVLREQGYLGAKGKDRNVPTTRSVDYGLMCVRETTITRADGSAIVTRTPMVTGKGQAYFVAHADELVPNAPMTIC